MKTSHSPTFSETSLLLEKLLHEVLAAFFDLRAAGQKYGLVTEQGAGSWGLLRMLKIDGPMTVPEVARYRSVSRQYIQKLANELIDSGWITLGENPAHKKSKRLHITRVGEMKLGEMTLQIRETMEKLAPSFSANSLQVSIKTIGELRKQLTSFAQSGPH